MSKQELSLKASALYYEWLYDTKSDELHCKDDFVNASMSQHYFEEFIKWLEEVL